MKSQPIVSDIDKLYQEFKSEFDEFANKQKKASAKRAKKAITSLKKLITPLRLALKEDLDGMKAPKPVADTAPAVEIKPASDVKDTTAQG